VEEEQKLFRRFFDEAKVQFNRNRIKITTFEIGCLVVWVDVGTRAKVRWVNIVFEENMENRREIYDLYYKGRYLLGHSLIEDQTNFLCNIDFTGINTVDAKFLRRFQKHILTIVKYAIYKTYPNNLLIGAFFH
jgi:hypothetical protein